MVEVEDGISRRRSSRLEPTRDPEMDISNTGNEDDAFDIDLDFPSDVSASVAGLTNGRTPTLHRARTSAYRELLLRRRCRGPG